MVASCCLAACSQAFVVIPNSSPPQQQHFPKRQLVIRHYGGNVDKRAAEIRQKISKLKKEGRLKKDGSGLLDDEDDEESASAKDAYSDKVRQRLGDRKSKLLGFTGDANDSGSEKDVASNEESTPNMQQSSSERVGQIGGLKTSLAEEEEEDEPAYIPGGKQKDDDTPTLIDPTLFEDIEEEDDEDEEVSEEELVDLVAKRMMEKRDKERQQRELEMQEKARQRLAQLEKERQEQQQRQQAKNSNSAKQLTSGVGGSWSKNQTDTVEVYNPKTGSWGAFPRPKDISKAYGGGRRVGKGYSDEDARRKSTEDTRKRLQAYREKVGIDVQSEKEHAAEIEEALKIGTLAMQRGLYSTAVSALEKVTKYCSTNSKVGGKVFLELAMAYEANGRTSEAIQVYRTLSTCRIEEIKFNAKRLLYGIEAMQFMQNEMKDKNFSRKKAKNTFIDTTGLKYMSQNFDDVYQTAYVDLQGGYYKKLTENVVRSTREARQILLRATNAGEVDRMRIVQALRSFSRNFDDALEREIERNKVQEPVAVMNGMPILAERPKEEEDFGPGNFVLTDSEQMVENLSGEWRLQLLADKRGDGVTFFNKTISSQMVNMETGDFNARIPVGFGSMQLAGTVEFNQKRRILRRREVETSGGGVFSGFLDPTTGVSGAVRTPQQVMAVDSILLVTRGVPSTRRSTQSSSSSKEDEKDYFAVWRRVR